MKVEMMVAMMVVQMVVKMVGMMDELRVAWRENEMVDKTVVW